MPAADDDKVWASYTKGVKSLRKTAPKPVRSASVATTKTEAQKSALAAAKEKLPAIAPKKTNNADFQASLDRNLERRLRQGSLAVEARLDLHGMTQAKAHTALEDFISTQIRNSTRCLLVITGKGRDGTGVIRANLAGWLAASDYARHILALRPAAQRHGGTGAFYVLLRRTKLSASAK
jgi:DNA-nicking Smr family endonuclease